MKKMKISFKNAKNNIILFGADAVKLEGGEKNIKYYKLPNKKLGINVIGHIGMLPQSLMENIKFMEKVFMKKTNNERFEIIRRFRSFSYSFGMYY